MQFRPRRSVLYVPAANERALDKARSLAADALIVDLEDSVAPEAKVEARARAAQAVMSGYGSRELIIRINGLDTPWGGDDLEAALAAAPDAILIPKVSAPSDLDKPAALLSASPASRRTRLWAMIETPLAIINAHAISASGHPVCLVLGTNDLIKETRARASDGRFALVPWLAAAVLAARASGLDVIDGVYNDFRDEAGFRSECERGKALGMDGKTLIHPGQIEICNRVFSPSPEDVEWSHKVIAAFARPESAGKGVITVDGRMAERLHLAVAERTVAISEAIGA